MRLHYLQHVPFEDIGHIGAWAAARGHAVTGTHLFDGATLPSPEALDWLVVMGGPMGVGDEARHPWLAAEKQFLRQCLDAGRTVIGICLGAQLLAETLGSPVYANRAREIGWYPVRKTDAGGTNDLLAPLPDGLDVFHWHGDTFDLPDGAVHLLSSEACEQQAFLWQDRALALQFHLETRPDDCRRLIKHCAGELDGSAFVQDPKTMLASAEARCAATNRVLEGMLDRLAASA